jgi:hypothetical protein|nr:MAG TPA: Protein of unknown function (DUF3060) [Bacteriophage sp.]
MNKIVLPFGIEFEAENGYSSEAFIAELIESQNYMGLNEILREYVEENQTTDTLNGLAKCLRNAIKRLYSNTNIEDVVYCDKDWLGSPNMFLTEPFSMAYSSFPKQFILSSSYKNILVSESDKSTIISRGEGCFIFIMESDCNVTVEGDNCFVYIAGDHNLVTVIGHNSKIIFSGNDNTIIIKGNSKFKGLSDSHVAFINEDESQYEIGKIHNPKFIKDLKFKTWYRFGYENGSFIEVKPNEMQY